MKKYRLCMYTRPILNNIQALWKDYLKYNMLLTIKEKNIHLKSIHHTVALHFFQ